MDEWLSSCAIVISAQPERRTQTRESSDSGTARGSGLTERLLRELQKLNKINPHAELFCCHRAHLLSELLLSVCSTVPVPSPSPRKYTRSFSVLDLYHMLFIAPSQLT